jgi:hypothetical protein
MVMIDLSANEITARALDGISLLLLKQGNYSDITEKKTDDQGTGPEEQGWLRHRGIEGY